MRQKECWLTKGAILVLFVMALLPARAGAASKYKILYKFTGGEHPGPGVIFDGAGNLYGSGPDVVFKLSPNSDGSWSESVLYSFTGGEGGDEVNALVFDSNGNLYGTTLTGGMHGSNCNAFGCGVVFKLSPNSDGSWSENVLYSFTGGADGAQPAGALIFDSAGNLYGTTIAGGLQNAQNCTSADWSGCGVVFQLSPNSTGGWSESVLYSFTGGADGGQSRAALIFDQAGNLYGTTYEGGNLACDNGGSNGCGVVFKLAPNSNGSWTESVLYSFAGGTDGNGPLGAVIFARGGNLYGTTEEGGDITCSCGTVFQLKPSSNRSWTETVLHRFAGHPAKIPVAGLVSDVAGDLYGTTFEGGPANGTVFRLSPQSGGSWTYSVLHVFVGRPATSPVSVLILDNSGNLYGTTPYCGKGQNCEGVAFEITP
jgi:uncharacterized repeat protein (TIGR03803 family)